MSWFNDESPEEIIGRVLKDYSVNDHYDELTLRFDDDSCCKFYHEQDCCEPVQFWYQACITSSDVGAEI
jgi:hypothetical protein